MARYKDYNYDQTKMLPISFDRQLLPGSFEYSLSYLIDTELDPSAFEQHYNNDENSRPAYDPRLLLKNVILAYSKGINSSRQIERLCRENIIFMTPSADAQPHCRRSEKQETPRQANVKLDITAEQKAGVIERMKPKIDRPSADTFTANDSVPSNRYSVTSPHRGDRDQAIQSPGPKEGRRAMEIDDDATQHSEDSQIWLGMGV